MKKVFIMEHCGVDWIKIDVPEVCPMCNEAIHPKVITPNNHVMRFCDSCGGQLKNIIIRDSQSGQVFCCADCVFKQREVVKCQKKRRTGRKSRKKPR